MINCQQLLTVGDIARAIGVPKHRVAYAIDESQIEPAQRAGIIWLFRLEQCPAIESALKRISDRREVERA